MSPDSQLPVHVSHGLRSAPEFVPIPPRQRAEESGEQGVPWARYIAACLRYKWMILLLIAAGAGAGVVGSRFIDPEYQATATVWISEGPAGEQGPIRAQEILSARAWPELLKSYAILDKVVLRQRLYLSVLTPSDWPLFSGFALGDRILPGQ